MDHRIVVSGLVLVASAMFAGAASAEEPCRKHHRPPPEALAACENKSEGDACTVDLGERTIDGTCEAPKDKQLACVPKDMPAPPDRQGD